MRCICMIRLKEKKSKEKGLGGGYKNAISKVDVANNCPFKLVFSFNNLCNTKETNQNFVMLIFLHFSKIEWILIFDYNIKFQSWNY